MLMVAPSGRENDDNSEDTPNSSFVTEVVIGREPLLLVVLAVTTHTFQIPCSHFFTGNFARSATIGIYISKTRITSEA